MGKQIDFTFEYEEATERLDVPVQCGECYVWYDGLAYGKCPICDSDEIVGNR